MRIDAVTAAGFGPLTEQTLALAPGLTVITGGNESGKSSWHAAVYAALCGRRRSRGRPSAADQQFIEAHQPWSGGRWLVTAELTLDDGRQIELRQELSGLVDCRAVDVGLGRDVSAEIIHDGSPDASLWLGLSRSAFRATACVGQAELLDVIEAADGLQQALQRATATAGTASTAAAAIDDLETVRRAAVGRDTITAVRPLRKALDGLEAARARLEQARGAAGELGALAARRTAAQAEAAAAASALARAERALAVARAEPPEPAAVGRGFDAGVRTTRRLRIAAAAALIAAVLLVAGVLGAGVVRALSLVAGGLLAAALGAWAWRQRPAPARAPRAAHPANTAAEQLTSAVRAAEHRRYTADVEAARADTAYAVRAALVPQIAEAEEAVADAERELARVRELDETLELTIGFLARAQERVHREVVPDLTALLRYRLPQLTEGRYVQARIDPATLRVEVCGPDRDFRSAQLLSHGTAEQIYLLLRVALVELLTAGHDTCPLLLDDVTVHADPERTDRMLELLLELSAERQIVLFAQQDQVRAWASVRLSGSRDAHIELEPALVSRGG
jgi:DNA repair exonuclease SbcCD ATPase subunit